LARNPDPERRGELVGVYSFASGRSCDDCVFLGKRYNTRSGDAAAVSDFWVLATRPTGNDEVDITRVLKWKNWLTAIWRSPAGVVYVSGATSRAVHRFDDVYDLAGRPPVDAVLDAALEGIWGLDDRHLYAWGTRRGARGDLEHPVFHGDGQRWVELPAPGPAVIDLQGDAPDRIYAVGYDGLVARWDGHAWRREAVPTREVLCCVHVAGADEVYACGHGGSVLAGRGGDWTKIAEIDGGLPAFAVAKFKGALYVAGGPLGLYRWPGGGALELIKPNIKATWFDARQELVITCDNEICGTADGQAFAGTAEDFLVNTTADQDILD
jgi:hypothetical protein